jgi:hypothetical protein
MTTKIQPTTLTNLRVEVPKNVTNSNSLCIGLGIPVFPTNASRPLVSNSKVGDMIFNQEADAVQVIKNNGNWNNVVFNFFGELATADAPILTDYGEYYYDTDLNTVRFWTAAGWVNMATEIASGDVVLLQHATDPVDTPEGTIYLNSNDYEVRTKIDGNFVSMASTTTPISSFAAAQDPVNMNGNSITNLVLENSIGDPEIGVGGIYFNTTDNRAKVNVAQDGWRVVSIYGESISKFSGPTQFFDFGEQTLTNIADAVDPTDAVNLKTAQTLITDAGANYLASTATLNDIADANPASADVTLNSQKITDLADGVADADATNVLQMQTYVADAISNARSYGGVSMTAAGAAQAITAGTYVKLAPDATYVTMPVSNFTGGSNLLTHTGSVSGDMIITVNATVQSSIPSAEIAIAIYLNGSIYTPPSLVGGTNIGVNTPVEIQYIIPMETNDYVEVWGTYTSFSSNLTTTNLSIIATLA